MIKDGTSISVEINKNVFEESEIMELSTLTK